VTQCHKLEAARVCLTGVAEVVWQVWQRSDRCGRGLSDRCVWQVWQRCARGNCILAVFPWGLYGGFDKIYWQWVLRLQLSLKALAWHAAAPAATGRIFLRQHTACCGSSYSRRMTDVQQLWMMCIYVQLMCRRSRSWISLCLQVWWRQMSAARWNSGRRCDPAAARACAHRHAQPVRLPPWDSHLCA